MSSKQKKSSQKASGFGIKPLIPTLQKVESLLRREEWLSARQLLLSLKEIYPKDIEVAKYLVEVSLAIGDQRDRLRDCEYYFQVNPKDPLGYANLFHSYIENGHFLLAVDLVEKMSTQWPNHSLLEKLRPVADNIQENLSDVLVDDPVLHSLDKDLQVEILLLHERGQLYLNIDEYDKSQEIEQQVLERLPLFTSARNNLSLIAFIKGSLSDAIAHAQVVLDQDPDNIHALSNLIRFHYLQGNFEQASTYGDRLKNSQSSAWDPYLKQVEGLSYLGDDAGIIDIFERSKASNESTIANHYFHHLVAVAYARQGRLEEARKNWEIALEEDPNYQLAIDNLDDLEEFPQDREGPWPFEIHMWIADPIFKDLRTLSDPLKGSKKPLKDEEFNRRVRELLTKHPALEALIPVLLERGDPQGRFLAFSLTRFAQTPTLLAALKTFALGQRGSDQMRMEAMQLLSEKGEWPEGFVTMWIRGEQTEIHPLSFAVSDESSIQHSHKVEKLCSQAKEHLHRGQFLKAEMLLREAIALEPGSPDLKNNLAVLYQAQGKMEEYTTLLHKIVQQFPDYVMARVAIAHMLMRDKCLEAASDMLTPLLTRKQFHYDELNQFLHVYVRLRIMQNQLEDAEHWVEIWRQVDPRSQEMREWAMEIAEIKAGDIKLFKDS